MTAQRANGVELGVEIVGRDTDPLVLLVGGPTMLSWPDAVCERLAGLGPVPCRDFCRRRRLTSEQRSEWNEIGSVSRIGSLLSPSSANPTSGTAFTLGEHDGKVPIYAAVRRLE